MSVSQYVPDALKIIHDAKVDFTQRTIQPIIRLVQYDRSLSIIAVKLYDKGVEYNLPLDANVSVRWSKSDGTFVYNAVLGCNSTRTIVYFQITEQMTTFFGENYPIIELSNSEGVKGTGYIPFYIDRNPIQEDDVESNVEIGVLDTAVAQAQEAARRAEEAAGQTQQNMKIVVNDTVPENLVEGDFWYDLES